MALTTDRSTPVFVMPSRRTFPVAANVRIFANALVVIDDQGNARPARDNVPSDVAVGAAHRRADNLGGQPGQKQVEVRCGIMRMNNDPGDPVTKAMVQQQVYVVDDETVSASSNNDARAIAGVVYDVVDDYGSTWVEVMVGPAHLL